MTGGRFLQADDVLFGEAVPHGGASVLDFWQWALGDVMQNSTRGIFCEWMVARLLGVTPPVRDPWAPYDLETPDGTRIEVKSAAYLQAWHQGSPPSQIRWAGLKGRTWDPEGGYAPEQTYNADLYVFCINTTEDPNRWNALDLSQWTFHVLGRQQVEALGLGSLSLSRLRALAPQLTAADLAAEVHRQAAAVTGPDHTTPGGTR